MQIDGIDFSPERNDQGTNRVLVVVELDITDPNVLLASQMEGRTFGHAGPGHMLSTAAAETIAAATWPPGVSFKGVSATLDGFTATRGPAR